MLTAIAIVFAAGALGGLVNALISDNRFFAPKTEIYHQQRVMRPGVLGNVFVSGVAAVVSWGLYGPFAAEPVFGAVDARAEVSITLAGFVGAIVVGMAGARWLSNEVDKRLLRVAASEAAAGASRTRTVTNRLLTAAPAEAARLATDRDKSESAS